MTSLRVAVVGIGDIAEKAYLPVLCARSDITIALVSRNGETLRRVAAQYRVAEQYNDVVAAVAAGFDAAFVHAATDAHPTIVAGFLTAGIPVFVDKPLAYSYADAALLVEQSRTAGVGLMVGFNRRYAPAYRELADWPDRDIVVMQKNRAGPLEAVRRSVFDDFIHVVDTVRFLGPSVAAATISGEAPGGLLRHVSISLTDGVRTAVGVMHRDAGMTDESLEVIAPGRKRRVVNVAEITDYIGTEQISRRDEWRSVGVQRGFAPMCDRFLTGVRSADFPDLDDMLATHRICEDIVAALDPGTPT